MTNEEIKYLEELREEKRQIEYFLAGNGNFGISIKLTLFKFFGCGRHEIQTSKKVTSKIIDEIKTRLDYLNKEIEAL